MNTLRLYNTILTEMDYLLHKMCPTDEVKQIRALKDEITHQKVSREWCDFLASHGDKADGDAIITPAITLEDEDEGCEFTFPPYRILFTDDSLEPLIAGGQQYGKYIHPHVMNNRLCLGCGESAYYKCMMSARFYDAFDIVMGVLSNYNSTDTYLPLYMWVDKYCVMCHNDAVMYCCNCNIALCGRCVEDDYCPKCGGSYCYDI